MWSSSMKSLTMREPICTPTKVRDQAQHESHVVNPGWPHWGRDALDHGHALYAIAAHLRSLGLESWLSRLTKWLGNYDGFEHYVDEGHDPCLCVRDLLASYVASCRSLQSASLTGSPTAHLKSNLVQDILKLEFLYYRVYWGRGLVHDPDARVWNPLEQAWMSFVESGQPEEELFSWRAELDPLCSKVVPLCR